MFDSGIKVSELIERIKSEADIAIPIPDESYIQWLNSVEQLLYTELIQEQGEIELDASVGSIIDETRLKPEGECPVRFEDVHAIYVDGTQLIKSTVASGVIFPDCYYKIGNNIGLNLKKAEKEPEKIKVIYFVKPALKPDELEGDETVKVPVEFIELVAAKLRGEAYKLANEGELAAMWLNDYNVLLETFKAWVAEKQPTFGL